MCPAAPDGRDSLISPEDNRRMFDRIARRYDLMNQIMSLGLVGSWRRRAVAMLRPRPGGRYLDVGCGSGGVALEILRQCPDAAVVGIDPAGAMLDLAAAKLRRAGLAQAVTLLHASVEEMDLPDGAFAGAISAFCVRNLADRSAALRQVRRVLAPGGRAVILELLEPSGPVLRLAWRASAARLVPLAGLLIARDRGAYQYLIDSIRSFGPPGEFMRLMAEAGFGQVRHTVLHAGIAGLFHGQADGPSPGRPSHPQAPLRCA